jgi:hypothetical protein
VKRICLASLVIAALAPSSAAAFHHTDLPATDCHAPAAGSPSNDNGMAKEALIAHSPLTLPLRRSALRARARARAASTAPTPPPADAVTPVEMTLRPRGRPPPARD